MFAFPRFIEFMQSGCFHGVSPHGDIFLAVVLNVIILRIVHYRLLLFPLRQIRMPSYRGERDFSWNHLIRRPAMLIRPGIDGSASARNHPASAISVGSSSS